MVLGAGEIYLSRKRLKLILPGTDILTVSEIDISLFLEIKTMNIYYTKSEPNVSCGRLLIIVYQH